MPLIVDLIIRYSLRSRRHGFARLVAWMSMLGMVIGVTSLVTVMSVMNGFANELESRILSLLAHATVTPEQGQMTDWQSKAALIGKRIEVEGVAPYMADQVLLEGWGRKRGAVLTGIDLQAQQQVSGLGEQLIAGSLADLESEPFSVVLGVTLARLMGVSVGDTVHATLPTLTVTPAGIFPRDKTLTVKGLFQVGADLDAKQAYVSLETARRLFGRPGVDGLQLRYANSRQNSSLSPVLAQTLGDEFSVNDWRITQGSLFSAVRMEKLTVAMLLLVVIVVAAFNIISTLTMSVTEKHGDIAVLRVMGLSSQHIMLVFMGQGVVLGGIGILLGACIGVVVSLQISDWVGWFEQLLGVPVFDPQVYYIGRLPSLLQWSDVATTAFIALLLSVLATVYPAWRASQIQPAEVLNHV